MKRFTEIALIGTCALLFGSPLLMLLVVAVTPFTLRELNDRLMQANLWLMRVNLQLDLLFLSLIPWVLGVMGFCLLFSTLKAKE